MPVVLASSPATAMHILHTQDKIFAGRPQHLSASHTINSCQNVLFSQPGPFWKLMRQIFTSNLFSTKSIDRFRPVRALEIGTLMRCIFAAQGSPLYVHDKLQAFTSASLSRMALGKPLHEFVSADATSLNIEAIVTEIRSLEGDFNVGDYIPWLAWMDFLKGEFNVGDYIPWLAWMDLQGYGRQAKEIARKAKSVFQAVIQNRRHFNEESAMNSPPRDFQDMLLLASSANAKQTELRIKDQ